MGQEQGEDGSGVQRLSQWPRLSKFVLSACAAAVAEMGRVHYILLSETSNVCLYVTVQYWSSVTHTNNAFEDVRIVICLERKTD